MIVSRETNINTYKRHLNEPFCYLNLKNQGTRLWSKLKFAIGFNNRTDILLYLISVMFHVKRYADVLFHVKHRQKQKMSLFIKNSFYYKNNY